MAKRNKVGTSVKGSRTNKAGKVVDAEGFEILGGGRGGLEVGEVHTGVFGGVVRTMPAKRKGQPPLNFYQVGDRVLIGSAVLKMRIEEGGVKVGDTLRVTRLEDGEAKKGQNAPRLFDVRVKRARGN